MVGSLGDLAEIKIPVTADLQKLLRSFGEAEAAAARFDKSMSGKVSDPTKAAMRDAEGLAASEARLAKSLLDSARAADDYGSSLEKAGQKGKNSADQVLNSTTDMQSTLKAAAASIIGAFGLNELKKLADGYTSFTNQLKVAGLEGVALADTQESLYQIAQKYGVQLEGLGTLYGRSAKAARELGASEADLLKFTNGVGAALKIQGGDAASSAGALFQLTQILSGTTVQAQEYNTLIDSARPILEAVAKGIDRFGGSMGKLREEVLGGKLTTAEFFNAFLKGSESLETQSQSATQTISASFTLLNNALGRYIGQTDSSLGATDRFTQGVAALASQVDVILPILTAIIVAVGARYTSALTLSTLATIRKVAIEQAAALSARTMANANLFAAASAGTMSARTAVATAVVSRMSLALGILSASARDAGAAMLAAVGGKVGLAITAIIGLVFLYQQRVAAAQQAIIAFDQNGKELAKTLEQTALYGNRAAESISKSGANAANATAGMRAFAGATGDAAAQLEALAKGNRLAALSGLFKQVLAAREDRAGAQQRAQAATQSGSSIARFGNLPQSQADKATSALEGRRIAEANRREATALAEIERLKKLDLESYVPRARTGGRDIPSEITQLQGELVAATKAGNQAAQREILKQIAIRKKITQYLGEGLSLTVAEATVSAEQIKAPSAAPKTRADQDRFTAADADAALAGIGAKTGSKKARPLDVQKRLRAKYLAYKAGTGPFAPLAAVPGTSLHGTNQARDVKKTPGMTLARIRDAIEGAGGRVVELLDEGSHFHVAWAKTAKSQASVADMQLREEQTFAADLARVNDEITSARLDQITDEDELSKLARERVKAQRDADAQEISLKAQRGQYSEAQSAQLIAANEALRVLQNRALDFKNQERKESEAAKVRDATHDSLIESLDAQQNIAKTATERREIERRILAAQKEYERAVLQSIIDSPFTKPIDRTLAQAGLAGLDGKFGGKSATLDRQTEDDLLGTAPRSSDSGFAQERDQITADQEEKLAIIKEALAQRIISEEEAAQRRVKIEAETAQKIVDIEIARKTLQLQAGEEIAGGLASIGKNILGENSKVYRGLFAAQKAFAIAQASIALYQNVSKAIAVGFPQNIPFIAAAIAQGATIVSNIKSISAGFAEGGFTGNGPQNAIAGTVHGQEFVVRAGPATKHRRILESINAGRDPTAAFRGMAGEQGLAGANGSSGRPMNIQLQNFAPGVAHEVQQGLTAEDVIIIARREAPKAVASDLSQPNSRTRKALGRHTTAKGVKT